MKNNGITTGRFIQVRSSCGNSQFLTLYDAEGDDLFQRIVASDKKWVYHFTPEKEQAGKNESAPKEAKIERSSGRVYLTCARILKDSFLKNITTMQETISHINTTQADT